mmetsp:Transcript_7036/g.8067  ORF Transcript_7036/g.8067 Transcript_7036/m.8067 type:complete len:242 (-) Transcript_7036:704-1429(-)|eukprot:CAMPEP_0197847550 /NCGR_PEP_ID=MMETSP1438-20131217/6379_1 /TAXON_ID=1461541 /ORGANISM="Pterosperma sp., Strain CCMP1384" /LENGTH=241 /DNA_ID=CAMNT_0043459501 /DNA_START=128 /DNA_END=853 /DNA_ORIENTATION=-
MGVGDDFRAALEKSGVRRLLFVRHANSGPAKGQVAGKPHPWDKTDQSRTLTSTGKKQSEFSRKWFQALDYKHKAFVVSPARRAVDTCQIMAETRTGAGADVSMVLLPSLHPLDLAPEAHKWWGEIGYNSLKTYDGKGAKAAFNSFGDINLVEIIRCLGNINTSTRGDTVTFFGHGVFINAIARRVAEVLGMGAESLADLTEINLGEAEGILVESNIGDVVLRHLHCRNLSVISDHPLYNVL